jgi:prepilin-type N-terminal cleavage/methylation domain-containing protein
MKLTKFQQFSKSLSGFTLTELLVAAAISSSVLTGVGIGMVNILSMDNNVEIESDHRMELDRTLNYIASDIRESKRISTSSPVGWSIPSGYTGVMYLTKPDNSTVAYYTRSASGTNWRGDNLIYRATASGNTGSFLLDAVTSTSVACTGSGTSSGVVVAANNLSANVCLQSLMQTSTTGETLRVNALAAIRNY